MLPRGALRRLGGAKTSARDLPQLARFLQRTILSRNVSSLPAVRALSRAYTSALEARRSYATTTSATKPTATVKRAVKAQAAEKAPSKPKATRTALTAKTAKKPKAANKANAKPKAKPRAKKALKKAAPKKRAPKALTPEQQEKAKIKKERAKLAELRKIALKEPATPRALNTYSVYVAEQAQGKHDDAGAGGAAAANGHGHGLVDVARKWKTLTPAEREHYNHLTHKRNEARKADYHAWVHSHTPQEIQAANNARAQLRRLLKNTTKKRYPAHTQKIVDDRAVKRPRTPYTIFNVERHASGDFKNIKVADASKLISEEWKALSDAEKKKYEDEYAAEKEKRVRESAAIS